MNLGFYIILAAQFFSALADNALLFAAIALLKELHAPDWHVPVLQQFFTVSYVVLAAFVGVFADAFPKGRVMLISNTIKFIGCSAMLAGLHPLIAYGIVGFGAAAYSPAKYGILTEYLPPDKLVWANGWMEGLTVASIILGAIVGSYLINPDNISSIAFFNISTLPLFNSPPKFAIGIVTLLYITAAIFNFYIPKVDRDHKPLRNDPVYILQDFWNCFKLLWRDPLGQVSLAVTTLFWGAGATLRLIVLAWAAVALSMPLEKATLLTVWVAIGIAIGSVIAAKYIKLEESVKVLPVGIAMGLVVIIMVFVRQEWLAVALLTCIGAMGGFFVVPMNALLQHRGHLLMGAGHSIAVQNFNENLSILMMLGAYALMIKWQWSIYTIIIIFGLFLSIIMSVLYRLHGKNKMLPP